MSSSSPVPRLFWAQTDAQRAARQSQSNGKPSSIPATSPRALKLIDVQKGKLLLAAQGTGLLKNLPPTAPLNLCFIFGQARSGKSFLMNCLSGTPGLFQVLNSSLPCTKGVDVSSVLLPLKAFRAHADSLPIKLDDIELGVGGVDGEGGRSTPASPAAASSNYKRSAGSNVSYAAADPAVAAQTQVGFVDVEGQGAEDGTYDTMLALPLLLTSKVVLFNHKGAPTVSDMLSKLGVLARAADYIDVGSADGEAKDAPESDEEEDGASRTTSFASQRSNGRTGKKFGHLHVVFRDFAFSGSESDVYHQLMGLEPLLASKSGGKATKSFHATPGAKSDRDRENDANKAIQERNDIRQLLLENFQSIHVWLLKQPASADELKAHKELPEELVDREFVSEVQKLTVVLAAQMAAPTLFNGATLTGERVANLLGQITQSLNSTGAISVPSVFRAMEDETVHRVYNEIVARFEAKLEKIRASLPQSKASILSQMNVWSGKGLEEFDQALAECVLQEEKTKRRLELSNVYSKARESLLATNQEMLLTLLKKTFADATAQVKASFDAFCAKVIPVEDPRTLEQEFAAQKAAHRTQVQTALAPYPELSEQPEYRYASLDAEESLTEFLALKLLSNDTQVKSAKIQKLQDEAVRQQLLLVEQNQRLEVFLQEEKLTTQRMEEELARLRADRDAEKNRVSEEQKRIEELQKQLEEVRTQKKKKDCTIL